MQNRAKLLAQMAVEWDEGSRTVDMLQTDASEAVSSETSPYLTCLKAYAMPDGLWDDLVVGFICPCQSPFYMMSLGH